MKNTSTSVIRHQSTAPPLILFIPQIVCKVGSVMAGDGSSREPPNFAGAASKGSSRFLKRSVHFYCREGQQTPRRCEVNSQSDCGPDLTQQGWCQAWSRTIHPPVTVKAAVVKTRAGRLMHFQNELLFKVTVFLWHLMVHPS